MLKTLEKAIAKISRLPSSDQEEIGRKRLSHFERLNALRAELDKGIRLLDAGEGRPLDMESFLRQKNSGYSGS
jgi:hypothetical protein